MICAFCRRPSISRIRASTMPCCSRAAWYSAFSLRSPSSRATPMSWLSLGRTTLVRCWSSSSRARAPWTVIDTWSCLNSCMKVLQTAHGLLRTEFERLTNCLATGNGGGDADLVLQSVTTNGVRISDGLTPFGGVDDQGNFFVLDHINYVRAPLGHLVHAAHRQTSGLDDTRRTGGGHHFEAETDKITGHVFDEGLIVLAHADEGATRGREDLARSKLSLGEGFGEAVADAHHLTGGLHLRTENGVHARELGEGEHCLLDAEERRNDFFGEANLRQGLASHDTRGHLGQGLADALGNERHGTRGA